MSLFVSARRWYIQNTGGRAVIQVPAQLSVLTIHARGASFKSTENTAPDFPLLHAPIRRTVLFSMTFKSFAAGEMSMLVISSRNRVPFRACSKGVSGVDGACREPLPCRKTYFPAKVEGMAAQLTGIKGRSDRGLRCECSGQIIPFRSLSRRI